MSFALRLDDVLNKFVDGCDCRIDEGQAYLHQSEFAAADANEAITSLIKELVAEAKPEEYVLYYATDPVQGGRKIGYDEAVREFEQNLLKALEEV